MTPREKAASLLTNAEVDGILDAHNICRECLEPLTVEGDGGDEPQHVFCDICGQAEHPADLTPDWNGETGNHISCEKQQKEVR